METRTIGFRPGPGRPDGQRRTWLRTLPVAGPRVAVQAAGVVPVHPAQGGQLEVLDGIPGPTCSPSLWMQLMPSLRVQMLLMWRRPRPRSGQGLRLRGGGVVGVVTSHGEWFSRGNFQ